MTRSEELLCVSRAVAKDGLAYRKLIEPYLPLLYRIAARQSVDRGLIDDIVQETLIVTYEKLHRYRPDASFKAFIAGIAVRKAHSMRRSIFRRRQRETAYDMPSHHHETPEHHYQTRRTMDALHRAIESLPTKQRQALVLRLDAQLSHAHIAQTLGTSEGSVRVLIHKACKHLNHELGSINHEEHYAVIPSPL